MGIRRSVAAGIIAAGTVGGIAVAGPASASINQSGCHDYSFKVYTSSTGYCFNGDGSTYVGIGSVNSVYTAGYNGAFSYQTYGSNPANQPFSYGQTYQYGTYFTVINLTLSGGPTS
jgi:hypothetical protein